MQSMKQSSIADDIQNNLTIKFTNSETHGYINECVFRMSTDMLTVKTFNKRW